MKENVRPLRSSSATQEIRIVLQLDQRTGQVELPRMPQWDESPPESGARLRPEPMPTLSSAEVVSLDPPAAASDAALETPTAAHLRDAPAQTDGVEAELLALRNEAVRLTTERDDARQRVEGLERELQQMRERADEEKRQFEDREQHLLAKCRELRERSAETSPPWSEAVRRFTDRSSELLDSELFRPWYRKPTGVVLLAAVAAAAAAWIGFSAVGPMAL